MASLKFLMWNCGGLTTTNVSQAKSMFFEKNFNTSFDAAFFVETHHTSDTDIPQELLRYQNTHTMVHSFATLEKRYTGILGLIHNDFDIVCVKNPIQGRIMNIKMKHVPTNTLYNLSVIYMYTNKNITKKKIEDVTEKLREEVEDHPNNMI